MLIRILILIIHFRWFDKTFFFQIFDLVFKSHLNLIKTSGSFSTLTGKLIQILIMIKTLKTLSTFLKTTIVKKRDPRVKKR